MRKHYRDRWHRISQPLQGGHRLKRGTRRTPSSELVDLWPGCAPPSSYAIAEVTKDGQRVGFAQALTWEGAKAAALYRAGLLRPVGLKGHQLDSARLLGVRMGDLLVY